MKEIILTRGYKALVDDDDFEAVRYFSWNVIEKPTVQYAYRRNVVEGKITSISMHRHLLNPPENVQVDHIDHNGLNNQRSNLRLCTHAENARHSRKQIINQSGYKGVIQAGQRWNSSIRFETKKLHIGTYSTKEEAAKAYDIKAKELFGEFAALNFPQGETHG